MVNDVQFEIDLLGLFRFWMKKKWIILGVTILCCVLSFTVSQFVLPREYTASSRVYVLSRTQSDAVTSSDLMVSGYLVDDLKVLITGRNVTEAVITALDLDMSHEMLAEKIYVSAEENTRVLQISVTDNDARLAADIANCVRQVASEQIMGIMEIDAVKLVYDAEIPGEPSSPNVLKNTVMVSAAGFLAVISVLSVLFFLPGSSKQSS